MIEGFILAAIEGFIIIVGGSLLIPRSENGGIY